METNTRNKKSKSKSAPTKVPVLFLDLKMLGESFGVRFWRLNDGEKGMTDTFSGRKLTSKLCCVYLEVKLQQNTCTCCI